MNQRRRLRGKSLDINQLTAEASRIGFLRIGFCRPGLPPFFHAYERYLKMGYHGDMGYLSSRHELRKNPDLLLPGLKTIICAAYPYSMHKLITKEGLSVARFANPFLPDYHRLVKQKLILLVNFIRRFYPYEKFRIFVDSGPVMEKAFSYLSGIGFFGKNSTLIIPEYGSYFFLGEIFTTAEIHFRDAEPYESMCLNCEKCIRACPQGAIAEPYLIDSRKCLSYLTIEYQGPLHRSIVKGKVTCFYGCDICQEVCPYNKKGKTIKALPEKALFEKMKEEDFHLIFGHSALSRAGLERIRRNLQAIGAC